MKLSIQNKGLPKGIIISREDSVILLQCAYLFTAGAVESKDSDRKFSFTDIRHVLRVAFIF